MVCKGGLTIEKPINIVYYIGNSKLGCSMSRRFCPLLISAVPTVDNFTQARMTLLPVFHLKFIPGFFLLFALRSSSGLVFPRHVGKYPSFEGTGAVGGYGLQPPSFQWAILGGIL